MRLFELLLYLSNISLFVLTVVLKKGQRIIPVFVASGIAAVLLVIHWTVEGYRVQLFLSYCITVFFLAISSYSYFKKSSFQKIPRFLLGSAYTAIAIMLVGTAVLMYTFPVFKLPELTGIFKVGTQTFHFVDTNREEIFDKAREGKRELMVQVWYPTQAGSGKRTALIPDTRILSYMAANYGLPGFTFQHLKYVSSHAYQSCIFGSGNLYGKDFIPTDPWESRQRLF